ncbi:hypothetical protein O181_001176 [Austropuccinia psidii MF-1]|uniref:Uncharacterized protein n=1 Tax=Austropuccinia psidii MF-1 TaxID=1389203 RepID=A0A9Q3B9U2_9BASI|nr:hypothetical protein [Austropuccinia psidii MF-1]
MPDTQRIEGGSKEGEYSVSSVSLELISRVMEAKGIIHSDMHIRIVKVIKIWYYKSIYGRLNVLNVGLQDCFGPQSTIQDLSSNSGEVTILHGPGPSSMVQAIKSKRPPIDPLDPL